jgi:hypothetical protein
MYVSGYKYQPLENRFIIRPSGCQSVNTNRITDMSDGELTVVSKKDIGACITLSIVAYIILK